MKNINRRENPRVDIKLRCHVTSPAVWLRNATYTENISRGGLMIAWGPGDGRSSLPRVGQIMTIEIELPAHHGFGPKCIHCQGAVVRISDSNADTPRVALSVNYMDFRSFSDRLAPVRAVEPAVGNWMA
jgi:c-di-GMP-binding flagellar brake protein YcgR